MRLLPAISVVLITGSLLLGGWATVAAANRFGRSLGILLPMIPLLALMLVQSTFHRVSVQATRRILAEGLADPGSMLKRAGILYQLKEDKLYKRYVLISLCCNTAVAYSCGIVLVALLRSYR
jgi:UDP-N-acetylmuramyl pentapeptide phosphotransferase/UDP-N-acetylglucosamine-1-phosphate transferase